MRPPRPRISPHGGVRAGVYSWAIDVALLGCREPLLDILDLQRDNRQGHAGTHHAAAFVQKGPAVEDVAQVREPKIEPSGLRQFRQETPMDVSRISTDELPEALASARAAASAAAKFPAGAAPQRTCRYCGGFWACYGATTNDGHAVCLVTEPFRRALVKLWSSSPTMSMQALATLCGTSRATINAWIHGRSRTPRGSQQDLET